MVSFSTLKRVAVLGGVIAIGGGVYFTEKIQENFRKELYYRKSMSMLRRYPTAVETFGEPIVSKKLDLGDTKNNCSNGLSAKLKIPVKGPKDRGSLYVQASRHSVNDSWDVDKLDLELESNGTRWTFYRKSHDKATS